MKQIQQVPIWSNGQIVQADALNAYTVNDNLVSQASFWYGIGTAVDFQPGVGLLALSQGNLTMTGDDYIAYETNQYAM